MESEPTATILEQHIDALATCIMAYGYPSDAYARAGAVINCQRIGLDYIQTIAGVLEHMVPATTNPDAAAATARWAVVDHIANQLNELRKAGALPRAGILTNGQPCNALGDRLDDEENDYV